MTRIDGVAIFYLLGILATGSMTISCQNVFESDIFTFTVLAPRERNYKMKIPP